VNRLAPLAASALLALAIGARAQQPTFRAGVEVVDVDVSVLDKHRTPIRGLTASDFTVLEDGKPRPVVAFSSVDLPPRELPQAHWMAEFAPDVQTNEFRPEGRLVVILLDRSVTMDQSPIASRIAEAAVNELGASDQAAVLYSLFGVPQNFTSDRRRLLAAIRRPLIGLPASDRGNSGACFCGTCTLESIARIAEAIREVRQRRKVLFFIGSSMPIRSSGMCGGPLDAARERAIRAADAANLTIYTFDTSGMPTLATTASNGTPPTRMANLIRQGNLMVLPDRTGGQAVFSNDAGITLHEVFRESSAYYVLGFHPAHTDGRFHDIKVKVNRSDAILQARRGYYAGGGAARASTTAPKGIPPALHGALAGLWPKTELPLTMSVAPIALPGMQSARVAVVLGVEQRFPREAGGVLLPDPPGPRETTVNVLVGAFDRNGQAFGYERQTVSLVPRRVGDRRFQYDVVSHLELKPGKYEIRAAVEDTGIGQSGSVYTDVDVPSFYTEFVSLSGGLIHTEPPGIVAVAPAWRDSLPVTPTTRRQFTREDKVTVFFQMYQGVRHAAMPGYVIAEIQDEHERTVFQQETRSLPSDLGANRASNLTFDLPMNELDPGDYLFSVEVRHGNQTARRDLRFNVVR